MASLNDRLGPALMPIALTIGDLAGTPQHRVDRTPFTIGRRADRDLVLPHDFISREHARIHERNGELWIEDTRSHGTALNGTPIARARIRPGDHIQLGGPRGLTLLVHPATPAAEESIRDLLDEIVHSNDSELSKLNWLFEAARRLNAPAASRRSSPHSSRPPSPSPAGSEATSSS